MGLPSVQNHIISRVLYKRALRDTLFMEGKPYAKLSHNVKGIVEDLEKE
jgi:hypothetical protein